MRILRIGILLLCFSCFASALQAQMRSEKFKMAEELMYRLKYYEAAVAYEEVLKESPNLVSVRIKLARLYDQLNHYPKAIQHYQQLLDVKLEEEPLIEYQYAILLKKDGQYKKSIEHFEHFIKDYQGGDKSFMAKKVKDQITGCERALLAGNKSNYTVRPLSEINSAYTDLSPVIKGNQLVFSTIPSDTPLIYIDEFGIQNFMELYEVTYDHYKDSVVSAPKKFGKNYWNEANSNVTGGAFSADGKRFYFSSCKLGLHGVSSCQIMGTALTDSGWTTPKNLGPLVNDPEGIFSSTHPALSEDVRKKRDILYFASNRPGGEGGFDLYEVEVDQNFNAGKLDNLGKRINSEGNEITPFIDPKDQSLYFSSDGLIGAGGYDVQKAKRKGKRLDKPKQLGSPFNTSKDEFYFSVIGKDKFLLVSNREGAKAYYQDYILDDVFLIYKPQIHKFLLVNVQMNDSAKTATNYIPLSVNGKDSVLFAGQAWEVPLDSVLMLKTKGEGLINASSTITITEKSPDTTYITLVVDQIVEEREIRLNNIYFAFNSDSLTDSSKIELEALYKILTDNPLFKIEIGAHTDNIGKEKYNLELSQKRAQSVVTFLLEKGVRPERLVAKGYGMSQPIAPNELENGEDNPEGRQRNRRIVFKIIGSVEAEVILNTEKKEWEKSDKLLNDKNEQVNAEEKDQEDEEDIENEGDDDGDDEIENKTPLKE